MPTCFVSMGFGVRTDFSRGKSFNLDKTYSRIIKPAALAAGLECVRADEIAHSGPIDVPMFELLLTAEVVICDISTLNANALYELGVRHALRPHTTIVIAEDGLQVPFDGAQWLVRRYHHLGEGIDFEEVERMRSDLTEALRVLVNLPAVDSPVYTFLRNLSPPVLHVASSETAAPPVLAPLPREGAGESVASLMEQSEAAIRNEDWDRARALLEAIRASKDAVDPYVLQRLALATYRSRKPTQRQAVEDARDILAALAPGTLNDPAVLSIWGAIHKRQWELGSDPAALDTAVAAYQKAFHLRGDYQDGTTLAFILNARATSADGLEAIADFVAAQRVRREVVDICTGIFEEAQRTNRNVPDEYAVRAALAEAWYGLGDDTKYVSELARATAVVPHPSLRESTQDRIARLGMLLELAPPRYLLNR